MSPAVRKRLFLLAGAGWLVVALAAARADWPTPEKLSEQRYRLAILTLNAADKTFLPDPAAAGGDWDRAYQRLAVDFAARLGPRFDLSAVEARHREALAGMTSERMHLTLFTLAATAALWGLLTLLHAALGQRSRQA
ncbi:MAG TPA: hypothetical protein PKC79_09265 [Solidesulfovibrio magneticus]|nr:hypothetical protein [Solidesulfovibrio magneticus]